MTVYVDNMKMRAKVGSLDARWSHLTADTKDELHAFARSIGLQRAWFQDKPNGHWHYDVTDGKRNQAIFKGAVEIDIDDPSTFDRIWHRPGREGVDPKKRLKYKWKIPPYQHQLDAVKFLLSNKWGGALLMEPRTGKTKVCVDYASILYMQNKITRVIVFCPVGVIGVWEDQIADHCPMPHRILVWDRKSRKENPLPAFGKNVLDFVIINYDALSTPGDLKKDKWGQVIKDENDETIRTRKGGRFTIMDSIKRWQPDLMILDESHRIKSPSAKKSSAIHTFKSIPYRIISTGTVVTKEKRIFDIYSQWKFLNPGRFGMTFSQFKSHFGRWKARENYSQWLGNQNEEELHTSIHQDSFSVLREDCFDLPKSTSQVIHVDMEESAPTYDAMAEDMVARIKTGEITEASIKLVQYLRLAQITGGIAKTVATPGHPKGRLVVVGSEKLRAIESRLEDLMDADEKVVIGAHFLADIARLEKLGKKLKVPVFVVKGGIKSDQREYNIKEFRRVSGGAIFIGQPSASSEGIDLSCASIIQWYSLTNSWVHFRQFSDRIALSEKPTFHEFFLARGTVDELKYETLLNDEDLGKMIIQSPERLLRTRNEAKLTK